MNICWGCQSKSGATLPPSGVKSITNQRAYEKAISKQLIRFFADTPNLSARLT